MTRRRARNPRRITLDFLRAFKNDVSGIIHRWNVDGRVYLDPSEREEPSRWWRPRQRHEYPEHDPQAWACLANDADEMARSLAALARFAREQRAAVLEATAGDDR
ncbi:hypothetical protein [Verrucosispora sp. WMMC514]|uniref:hypothetical protein n=1 Tax=Verrucosispora sp. WMMC514 TaxID=3015156 RepID=UPI00248B58CC|nr:hypothetical protein [Verrucosispora sp. WMMC514]WBB94097.1 hypothetical protein O7597_14545 [Verrucosispora sp. WMMC514]